MPTLRETRNTSSTASSDPSLDSCPANSNRVRPSAGCEPGSQPALVGWPGDQVGQRFLMIFLR